MTDKKISGADIVMRVLLEQGVDVVFGYPGGMVIDLYDALYRVRGKITHYLTAHEQGAAHAADGYARATGKPGVVFATSGPGATNLVTGIACAMLDSVPMIAITGNVPRALIGRDAFQEIDITGITIPITKHNFFVTDINDLADTVREAFRIAISGRPGPVLIDIPKDIQTAKTVYTQKPGVTPDVQTKASDEEICSAAALLNESKRPCLYIGGGVVRSGSCDLVKELAEKTGAVICSSLMGIGAVPTSYPGFLGMEGLHGRKAAYEAIKESDLIVALGVRFSDRSTGDAVKSSANRKIIQFDVDKAEIGKNVYVDFSVCGDMKDALTRLIAAADAAARSEWRAFAEEQKAVESPPVCLTDGLTVYDIISVVNRVKDKDTVIVTDVGQHQMWTARYADIDAPENFLTSGGLGAMGFGMGASVGAAIGSGKRVILITGDGSFGMDLIELATAVTYRVPLTVVVVNNGTLGMVRQWQTLYCSKRYSSTTLDRHTDFSAVAAAFGAEGTNVSSVNGFERAFKAAFNSRRPSVIDASVSPDETVPSNTTFEETGKRKR